MARYTLALFVQPLCLLSAPAGSFSRDIDELNWVCVFVHVSAVERAGLAGLAEGQKVNFETKTDKMRGKVSAENLSLA